MDPRSLLDQLLQSGKDLVHQGKEMAENALDLPEEAAERDSAVSGLKKGAVAGGLLALLLGTRAGRRLGGSALKLGGLAALGGLAYKAYQDWQEKQGQPVSGQSLEEVAGPEADQRSVQLIRAMIAAAKADGHIDENEREKIKQQIEQLGLSTELSDAIRAELDRPLSATDIAAGAESPASAAETYLASLMVLDVDSPEERAYLDELATALGLSEDYAAHLQAVAK